MIWACFVGNKLGPIAFMNSTVNSDVYIDILCNNLLPYLDALANDGISSITFQQDNARPHTSKKTSTFVDAAMIEHGFHVMEWPPNSPDMNPIENLWAHLKRELHHQFPDTKTLRGPPHIIRRVLRDRLMEVWWEIEEKVLDRLIDSMPHRVQALIDADGWYTDF
jgi:transposase